MPSIGLKLFQLTALQRPSVSELRSVLLFFCFEVQNIISETYFGSVGPTLLQCHNANAQCRNPNPSILFSLQIPLFTLLFFLCHL